jgi:hypothetical protein
MEKRNVGILGTRAVINCFKCQKSLKSIIPIAAKPLNSFSIPWQIYSKNSDFTVEQEHPMQ